jgi:tight adherence protein C
MNINAVLGLVALFLGIALSSWAIIALASDKVQTARRLREFSSSRGEDARGIAINQWVHGIDKIAAPVLAMAMPDNEQGESALRASLNRAGWRGRHVLPLFVVGRVVLTLALPLVAWLVWSVIEWRWAPSDAPAQFAALLLASAALGYFLPVLARDFTIQRRQRAIFETLPDALDLMLICVEAGLSVDAAMQRVADEIRLRSSELADELGVLVAEIRAGAPRDEALRRMAGRTGLVEVSSFASLVAQAERFGTSLGAALRVQAEALRTTRRLEAEERAAKVPVKLLIPLVFCIFPSLFIVLLGPAAIRIWRVLVPALQSGT